MVIAFIFSSVGRGKSGSSYAIVSIAQRHDGTICPAKATFYRRAEYVMMLSGPDTGMSKIRYRYGRRVCRGFRGSLAKPGTRAAGIKAGMPNVSIRARLIFLSVLLLAILAVSSAAPDPRTRARSRTASPRKRRWSRLSRTPIPPASTSAT